MGDHWARSVGVLFAFEELCELNNSANENEQEEEVN